MRRRAFLYSAGSAGLSLALSARAAVGSLGTIAFIQRDGLWVRSLPDGKPERLVAATALASPCFSPSGQWIAYLQAGVLHVVSAGGASRIGLAVTSGARWFPNRDELLVDSTTGLQVFTPANGWSKALRSIQHATLPVGFSPQGNEIAYGRTGRTGRLCRLSLDQPQSEPTVLVSNDFAGLLPCLWSANGKQVLFWEDLDFSASLMADGLELFSVPADGGSPRSLGVSTLVHNDMLSLSPDRTRLAITAGSGRYEWAHKRIAIVDLNTSAVSFLTDGRTAAVCPSWCPRGDRIAFSAAPSPATAATVAGGEPARRLLEKRRIWITGVSETSTPKQLTDDPLYRDEEPMWSADGSHILFARIDRNDNQTLWLMDAESPHPIQVAGPLHTVDQAWFGYYGYIDWRAKVDWYQGAAR